MRHEGTRRLAAPLAMLMLTSACAGTSGEATSETPTGATTAVPNTTVAAAPSPAPRPAPTKNWFDLQVGDCLAEPPPTDPNVITVPVVECATAHQAEVYLRSPMAVNTALADVADRTCGAGFTAYTGRAVGDSAYTVTYLIDSNQNRTSSNPNPSAVICLLQSADGQPLTRSARR